VNEAWIIDAVRTPRGVGKVGKGALSHMHPQRVMAASLRALRDRNDLDTRQVDDVVLGCGTQVFKQGNNIARMAVLDAGWDVSAGGITVSRFCGSGLSSVNMAASSIMAGAEDVLVAGGVEVMSYVFGLGVAQAMDSANLHLRELFPQPHQGVSADAIATIEGIGRSDLDELALESQRRAAKAIENGWFDRSVVPVFDDEGKVVLDHEEFPRPDTTLEKLASLEPSFSAVLDMPVDETGATSREMMDKAFPGLQIEHVHHPGNSSGVVDGSAAILLASPEAARRNGWIPRAKIKAMANAGGDPVLMLNEPGPAAQKVLKKAGLALGDIDLIEVNEAFAVVAEKFMRDLGVDRDKCNVNGGAIALGHPIGATGSILIGTLLDELERRDGSMGLVTMCTGGGMAPAVVIERV